MDDLELTNLTERLRQEFDRLNNERFEGVLPAYRLKFSKRAVRTHGNIVFSDRLIRISLRLYLQFGWDAVVQTLLHEMTHAFIHSDGGRGRHGRRFWDEFRRRGGLKEKYDVMPERFHVYACPTCGQEIRRMRRLKRHWRFSCSKCDRKYNPNHRLYLKKEKS